MYSDLFESDNGVTLTDYVTQLRAATYRFERYWIEKNSKTDAIQYPMSFEAGFGGIWEEMFTWFLGSEGV